MRPTRGALIRRSLKDPACKAAMSAAARASWSDPEKRARRMAALKAAAADPEKRARRIVMIRRAKRDEEARSIVSKSMRIRWGGNKLSRSLGDVFAAAPRIQFDGTARTDAAFLLHDVAAFEASLAASALVLGIPLRKARRGARQVPEVGHARRLATYLAVTHFGVPRRRLMEARGKDRRRLRRNCNLTEEMRSDAAYDALVASIEARLG